MPRHRMLIPWMLLTTPTSRAWSTWGIPFITLRRRSPALLNEIEHLAPSAWRRVTPEVPARKFKTPRVLEQPGQLAGATFRQLFILDLGHEELIILLTNDRQITHAKLITRCDLYAVEIQARP